MGAGHARTVSSKGRPELLISKGVGKSKGRVCDSKFVNRIVFTYMLSCFLF